MAGRTWQDEMWAAIKRYQVPCPWGDLRKGEGVRQYDFLPELNYIPKVPLALAVGCGHSPEPAAYKSLANTKSFGKLILSDIISPQTIGKDYLQMDITDPEEVRLGGYKVHAILSLSVFTFDTHSVNLPDRMSERSCAESLSALLMPGGFISNQNIIERRFERHFIDMGYKKIPRHHIQFLQKPF